MLRGYTKKESQYIRAYQLKHTHSAIFNFSLQSFQNKKGFYYVYAGIYPHTYLIPSQLSKLKKKKSQSINFEVFLGILDREIL